MSVLPATQSKARAAVRTVRGDRQVGQALPVIAAAQLMVILDTAIVNVALPHMQSGVAASLRNTAQQTGGSIGLPVLGTIAFTAATGIMLLALAIAVATIRIRKADLAGVNPI